MLHLFFHVLRTSVESWETLGMLPKILCAVLSVLSPVLSTTTTTQAALALDKRMNLNSSLNFIKGFHTATTGPQSPSPPLNSHIYEYAGMKVIYTTYGVDSFAAGDTRTFIRECRAKIKQEREELHRRLTDEIPGEVIRYRDRKLGDGLLWMIKGTTGLTYLTVEVALRGTEDWTNACDRKGHRVKACTFDLYDQLQSRAVLAEGTLQSIAIQ